MKKIPKVKADKADKADKTDKDTTKTAAPAKQPTKKWTTSVDNINTVVNL